MSALNHLIERPFHHSPPLKDQTDDMAHDGRREADAEKLRFNLPMVLYIVGTALAVSGAQYVTQAGQRDAQALIQSDIRDIRTQMASQAEMRAKDKENLDLKLSNMKLEVEKSELRKALLEELKNNRGQ